MDDVSISIDIEDNMEEVLSSFNATCEQLLYLIGTECVAQAVKSISGKNLAVDTGRLRASISFVTASGHGESGATSKETKNGDKVYEGMSVEPDTVIVGTNVEYAAKVHNGMWIKEKGKNKKFKVRPFLLDGVQTATPIIQKKAEVLFGGNGGE